MAEQIYMEEFSESRRTSYYNFDNDKDVRYRALNKVNEFFIRCDKVDIINIVEDWTSDKTYLSLVVYYKRYI